MILKREAKTINLQSWTVCQGEYHIQKRFLQQVQTYYRLSNIK